MASDATQEDSPGTLLYRGSEEGDLLKLRQAVEFDPRPSRDDLSRAAHRAAGNNHADAVRYLLDCGASAAAAVPGACQAVNTDIFQALYDHGWRDGEINESMIHFPLMLMVISHLPSVKWLIDHGMDVNLPAERGSTRIRSQMTPMNAAAYQGRFSTGDHVQIMEWLLSRGASVEPFALENAMERRGRLTYSLEVLQWLVNHGADVNYGGSNMLFIATNKGDLDLVRFLLRNGADTSAKNSHTGLTALEYSQVHGLDDVRRVFEEYLGLNDESVLNDQQKWKRRLRPRS